MIELYDKETSERLGTITEDQLQFMVDQLEEESSEDRDYYINSPTIEMFEEAGADSDLLNVLRQAMGKRDEMEIRWRHV